MITYNLDLLNENDLSNSFFCVDIDDPTIGFRFDATQMYGPVYPKGSPIGPEHTSLILASHLARYLRQQLEGTKRYTATVGIASNKVLSKLVGNLNKPQNQTTLLQVQMDDTTSVLDFMDSHDIGKVPGIGFKLSQKIRQLVLGRDPVFDAGLVYGGTKEHVSVKTVRTFPGMGPQLLEETLSGPGSQKGIGGKIWDLVHGIDDGEVAVVKRIPTQISQEDSYMKYLRTFEAVKHQLRLLAKRLIERMRLDLTEDDLGPDGALRWLAHPRTLRLSTRPRPGLNQDGTRPRTFHRISRSAPMPMFIFNLVGNSESLADKLVEEILIPMFRKLHPEKIGWNLSLINVAATNMAETGGETKDSKGRNIGRMFKTQDEVLKDFKVTEEDEMTQNEGEDDCEAAVRNDWISDDEDSDSLETCSICHIQLPPFAFDAHYRYHEPG